MSSMIQSRVPITQPQSTPLTVAEFINLYADEPVELIDGHVTEKPMSTTWHSFICMLLGRWFGNYAEDHQLGRILGPDVTLLVGPNTVYGPDVAFISYERMPIGTRPPHPSPIMPELIVEVRSPSNSWTGLLNKMVDYFAAEVRVVLIVDEETHTVSVFRPDGTQTTLTVQDDLVIPDLFADFRQPIRKLFEQ